VVGPRIQSRMVLEQLMWKNQQGRRHPRRPSADRHCGDPRVPAILSIED
jgi:hypothetical protein